MKQWLYDGWFRFKLWAFFNYWRYLTNEDADELRKIYYLRRWEKRAMKAYVDYFDTHPLQKEIFTGSDWYIGTINPEKMMNATSEKKDE
jgi:hypothetical protein